MSVSEYDLVVIGTGPEGQKGAIAAAKARKRVAIIDTTVMIGGVRVHTGTIPSSGHTVRFRDSLAGACGHVDCMFMVLSSFPIGWLGKPGGSLRKNRPANVATLMPRTFLTSTAMAVVRL